MANTFELISSYTATGSVSSIDFTSIPSTYTDLCLKISFRSSRSAFNDYAVIKFNGSSTGYTLKRLYGDGVSAGSVSDTSVYAAVNANTTTSNTFGSAEFYIPNYAGSNYKSISIDDAVETNATTNPNMDLSAGLWSNTAAITSIALTSLNSANFLQYSTAYLYGVKNA